MAGQDARSAILITPSINDDIGLSVRVERVPLGTFPASARVAGRSARHDDIPINVGNVIPRSQPVLKPPIAPHHSTCSLAL